MIRVIIIIYKQGGKQKLVSTCVGSLFLVLPCLKCYVNEFLDYWLDHESISLVEGVAVKTFIILFIILLFYLKIK